MEPKIIEKVELLSAEGLPVLDEWWWDLCISMIHQAILAVA